MQDEDTSIQNIKKKELLTALGNVVFEKRSQIKKGINTFSYEYDIGNGLLSRLEKGYEYDIGNGLLSRLEKGLIDTKITTLWKLANAFGYNKCSDFVEQIEAKLPDDFNFYN